MNVVNVVVMVLLMVHCDCAGSVDLGCGCGEAGPSGCDSVCGSDCYSMIECW